MSTISTSQILDRLNWRYATKRFDASKKIPETVWTDLEKALVLTPSSYGLQPWKFIVVTNAEIREKFVPHSWGQRQVADASHLVVMTVRTSMTEAEVDSFIQRTASVRGISPDAIKGYRDMMVSDVVNGARSKVIGEWAARQAYIALGNFMTVCALAGIDTCPMEGFLPDKFDEILGLPERGLTTVVLCPAGYRSPEDNYAKLAKVRFPEGEVIEHLA